MDRQTSRNSKKVVKRKGGSKEGQTVMRDKKESWNLFIFSFSCLSYVASI
jgi:hypothetical protein